MRVWSVAVGGQPPLELRGHADGVNTVAFDLKGDRVLTASDDATVRIWNTGSGQSMRTLSGHKGAVYGAAFSPDGASVLTASEDNTARIWNSQTGQGGQVLLGHAGLLSAEFDADAGRIITSGKDATARIWTRGGHIKAELRGHTSDLTLATFSRDGRTALTASRDKTARVWSVPDRGGFEVAKPEMSVDRQNYSGRCPVTVRLFAKIEVVSGSGKVAYKFVRKDGEEVDGTLLFDAPGVKFVSSLWSIRGAGNSSYVGSARVIVTEPNEAESQEVRFQVRCQEAAAPAPDSPPDEPTPIVPTNPTASPAP